jgi:DNA-binding transcriptional MerR regulator
MAQLDIPNRSLFRQPEVCEIASIQPYVLRSWEAEFPDLGVAKTEGGPRIYRKADVQRVLRIKQLLYGEGLTLAGARRRLTEEQPARGETPPLANIAELLGRDARERILQVKRGLRELATMLGKVPGTADDGFRLQVAEPRSVRSKPKPKPAGKKKR